MKRLLHSSPPPRWRSVLSWSGGDLPSPLFSAALGFTCDWLAAAGNKHNLGGRVNVFASVHESDDSWDFQKEARRGASKARRGS